MLSFFVANFAQALPTYAYCADVEHTDNTVADICDKNGKNYAILEFFSPRCGACQRNVVPFKTLETRTAEYASTRLISLLPLPETMSFVNQFAIGTPVALGATINARETYGITHVPTIVILDRNNRIIFHEAGVLNEDKINRIVNLVNK